MKSILKSLALVFATFFSILFFAVSVLPEGTTNYQREIVKAFKNYFSNQKFISKDEAKKRWGNNPFDAEEFRKENWRTRGPMVYQLFEGNTMIGKSEDHLLKLLGSPDGFFWDDHIPAYIIEDGRDTGKTHFQLVIFFKKERKTGKKIFDRALIHKQDIQN